TFSVSPHGGPPGALMRTVDRQQILGRRNQSIRITPLGNDPLPDRARNPEQPPPLLLQPMIERGVEPRQVFQKDIPEPPEHVGTGGPGSYCGSNIHPEFRPAHSDMMTVGGEQVRPIRKQDILQFMQSLTKRGAGLFVFATAPKQACQVQPQDRS
ncbi:MAG TPA: hypothetical protein VIG49_15880, partial [Acetobacteraceae bacterium]